MKTRSMVFLSISFAAVVSTAADLACTPAQQRDAAAAVPVAEKATCVLLRALTESGSVDEVCATADELAPLVPDLLASPVHDGHVLPDAGQARAVLAFSMPIPKRKAPRRHCSQWTYVDAGAP